MKRILSFILSLVMLLGVVFVVPATAANNNVSIERAAQNSRSVPATPRTATENANGGVLVKWNAVSGAVKYNIYRRTAGQKYWVLMGTTSGTSFTDTRVSSGTYYSYSVRAYNSYGKYSNYISSMTSLRKYMAVPKLTGISNATNGLYIKWYAVSGVTNGYRVYRRAAGVYSWTYLGTVKTTYFTDTAVKNLSGNYYRYTVIADGGYYSNFDTNGLYLMRLSNPVITIDATNGNMLYWDDVRGATHYRIYRKTANSNWTCVRTIDASVYHYPNEVRYQDWWIELGVPYTYAVRAYNGNVASSYYTATSTCYRIATG